MPVSKKDIWNAHFVPGTVHMKTDPPRLVFQVRLDSPESYNGRSMAGRIIEVSFGHTIIASALVDQINTALSEMGNQLPETMG